MRKSFIVAGLFLAGFGLLMLLPGFILSFYQSPIKKTSDVSNIIFNVIHDIFQDDTGTKIIEETKSTISFFEAIPHFLIVVGVIIIILGLIF